MKNKKNNFNASPLPFMGQKRNFANKFKAELQRFDNELVFVDLFGGSCLLSHITKQEKPKSKVICNDFDNFHLRIKSIDRTKRIIDYARSVLPNIRKNDRVNEEDKIKILEFIKHENLQIKYILETHIHADHVTGASYLKNPFSDALVCIHEGVKKVYSNIKEVNPSFLMTRNHPILFKVNASWKDS